MAKSFFFFFLFQFFLIFPLSFSLCSWLAYIRAQSEHKFDLDFFFLLFNFSMLDRKNYPHVYRCAWMECTNETLRMDGCNESDVWLSSVFVCEEESKTAKNRMRYTSKPPHACCDANRYGYCFVYETIRTVYTSHKSMASTHTHTQIVREIKSISYMC